MLVAELPMARLLGAGSLGYGVMVSGWAAGSLLGSLVAKRVVARHGELRALIWGAGCAAVALGAIGVAPWLASAAALLAVAGFLNAISAVAEETMVQRSTPDAVRSRVMAAQEAIWIAALGLGLGAGGAVLATVGVRATYILAGALGLAGTLRPGLAAPPDALDRNRAVKLLKGLATFVTTCRGSRTRHSRTRPCSRSRDTQGYRSPRPPGS